MSHRYRRSYPREVLTLRHELASFGIEVTPDQLMSWAWQHAKKLSRATGGVWTAGLVVGHALIDSDCFHAALEALQLETP